MQAFSVAGSFLWQLPLEEEDPFDSPFGTCMASDGDILVSDRNKALWCGAIEFEQEEQEEEEEEYEEHEEEEEENKQEDIATFENLKLGQNSEYSQEVEIKRKEEYVHTIGKTEGVTPIFETTEDTPLWKKSYLEHPIDDLDESDDEVDVLRKELQGIDSFDGISESESTLSEKMPYKNDSVSSRAQEKNHKTNRIHERDVETMKSVHRSTKIRGSRY